MSPLEALETMTNAELVPLYNLATGEAVRRFADRRTGIQRLTAAVDARPEIELSLVDGKVEVRRVETAEERRGSVEKTDRAILEILAELGPSPIGAIRKVLLARDEHFAALRERQVKGRMRAAVHRLEAAKRIAKDGSTFFLACQEQTA